MLNFWCCSTPHNDKDLDHVVDQPVYDASVAMDEAVKGFEAHHPEFRRSFVQFHGTDEVHAIPLKTGNARFSIYYEW